MLEIRATKTSYFISVKHSTTGTKTAEVAVESRLLTKTPPVGQPFLGAMFGVYAFGNWEPCLDPAHFKDIFYSSS